MTSSRPWKARACRTARRVSRSGSARAPADGQPVALARRQRVLDWRHVRDRWEPEALQAIAERIALVPGMEPLIRAALPRAMNTGCGVTSWPRATRRRKPSRPRSPTWSPASAHLRAGSATQPAFHVSKCETRRVVLACAQGSRPRGVARCRSARSGSGLGCKRRSVSRKRDRLRPRGHAPVARTPPRGASLRPQPPRRTSTASGGTDRSRDALHLPVALGGETRGGADALGCRAASPSPRARRWLPPVWPDRWERPAVWR